MTFNTCVAELVQAACEVNQDDPSLLKGDYEGFEADMWPDDECARRHGLDETAYKLAVSEAWRQLRATEIKGARYSSMPKINAKDGDLVGMVSVPMDGGLLI